MLEQIISKTATELSYVNWSSKMKDATTEKNWKFELGVGNRTDVPIYIIVGFMQSDRFNQQNRNMIHFIDQV